MRDTFQLISVGLYFIVGIISLIMAYKTLFSKKFVEFHEKASGATWESIDIKLQSVILALMRVSGLGFLIAAIIFIAFPIINCFIHDDFITCTVPSVGLVFCTGLLIANYTLAKRTKAKTPWKGALLAIFITITGFILSIIQS
jgi:4-amino-4-deoxy-L-arabinose transferase-like glycosyltransferase